MNAPADCLPGKLRPMILLALSLSLFNLSAAEAETCECTADHQAIEDNCKREE